MSRLRDLALAALAFVAFGAGAQTTARQYADDFDQLWKAQWIDGAATVTAVRVGSGPGDPILYQALKYFEAHKVATTR